MKRIVTRAYEAVDSSTLPDDIKDSYYSMIDELVFRRNEMPEMELMRIIEMIREEETAEGVYE